MNRTRDERRWRWAALACTGLLWLVLAAAAQADPAATMTSEQVIEQMSRVSAELSSLQADFVQTRTYPLFDFSDPAEEGTLSVKRMGPGDSSVRLEMVQPEHVVVTIKDQAYTYYQPRLNQAIQGKVNPAGGSRNAGFVTYLMGDLSEVGEEYSVELVGEEPNQQSRTVHLRLKALPDGQGYYTQIDLWVDTQIWFPVRQELRETNNTVTSVELRDLQFGVELDDGMFEQRLSSKVERVRG